MQELLDIVTKIAGNSSPAKVAALADAVKQCADAGEAARLSNWPTSSQGTTDIKALAVHWRRTGLTPGELAGMILGASHAYHRAKDEETIELVWTGPATPMISTRRTEQALIQVIESSRRVLFLVSFVAYEVASVTRALNAAIARGVKVSILLEPAEIHGGQIKDDCFANMRYSVPKADLYVWSEKNKESLGGGYRIVHVKCAVADHAMAFVTSANLTPAALERNMEMGVLIEGSNIARKLHEHLEALVATRVLVPFIG